MERGSLIVRINRYSYCMMEGKPINPAIDLRKEVTSIDQINVILILYRVRLNMSMRSDGVLSGASGKSAYKLLYLGAEVQYANQRILTRGHARRTPDR